MFLATVFLKLSTDACLTVTLAIGRRFFELVVDGRAEQRVGRQQAPLTRGPSRIRRLSACNVHVGVEAGDIVDQGDDRHVDGRPLVLQRLDAERVARLHVQHVGQFAREDQPVGGQLASRCPTLSISRNSRLSLGRPMMPTRRE